MAYSYEQILAAHQQRISDEYAQAAAEFEAARVSENAYGVTEAADRILALDQARTALAARVNFHAASQQQQPQGNKYGLSDDEMEVAKNSHSAGTSDQRIEEYARNKQRYQHARATGQYRDDQGTRR